MDLTGMTVLLHCDGCGDTTAFDVGPENVCTCRKCTATMQLWHWPFLDWRVAS